MLEFISAFNSGDQFNGLDVNLPDVLEAISAFNA
jgi:hypothetical protein